LPTCHIPPHVAGTPTGAGRTRHAATAIIPAAAQAVLLLYHLPYHLIRDEPSSEFI